MTEREYGKLVKEMCPASPMWKDCVGAFLVGGVICTLGQFFLNCYQAVGLNQEKAGTAASMSLVVLSALLTGLSLSYGQNMSRFWLLWTCRGSISGKI